MRRASILAAATLALASVGVPGRAQQAVDWTVMIYLNGDTGAADGEDVSISDFNELEQIGSNADVNVVVQWDRREGVDELDTAYPTETTQSWTTARRYLVTADTNQTGLDPDALLATDLGFRIATPVLLDIGEVDMGSGDTLVDFADWSMERFPADHYLLVIAGEGGDSGWRPRSRGRAMVFDNSPTTGSFLSNAELRAALAEIKALNGATNLDGLILDVDSHAIAEAAYEFRGAADYVMGRFLTREGDALPYDDLISRFAASVPQDMTSLESLLGNYASDYLSSYLTGTAARGGATSAGVGVYRSSRQENLADVVDTFADALLADLPSFAPGILRALAGTQRNAGANGGEGYLIDLVDFATRIAGEVDDVAVDSAAAAVAPAVTEALVNGTTASTVAGSFDLSRFGGLGIYFPAEAADFDTNYALVTQWATDTAWDELVQGVLTLFSDQNGPVISITSPPVGATIIQNPPELVATLVDQEPGGRVNASSIVVYLDGVQVDADDVEFDSTTGLLRYAAGSALSVTSHTFRIEARDLSGNLSTATSNFRIAVANLTAGLQTFSLPRVVASGSSDPSLVFGSNNFSLARWVPLLFGTDKYRIYPDTYASFLPPDGGSSAGSTVAQPPAGLGYWVRIREARPLSSMPGSAVTSSEYKIRLYANPDGGAGWNMIGCPYDVSAVGLASMFIERANGSRITFRQAVSDNLTPGTLFTYVPNAANVNAAGRYTFAEAGEGQLLRLKGHWLKVNEDVALVVPNVGNGRAVDSTRAASRPALEWSLEVTAESGDLSDSAQLGVARAASRGYDSGLDVAAPPLPAGGLEVRAVHGDWGNDSGRYVRDVRGPGQEEAWDLEVGGPAGPVVLRWPNLRGVPADVDLLLTDLANGRRQRLRSTAVYRFDHDGTQTRSFRVTAAPKTEAGLQVTGLTVTRGRGGGYEIGYTTTASADVTLSVRSLSGRVLRSLPTSAAGVGRSTQHWDGRAADGKPLPNGIYQLELVAAAGDGAVARSLVTVRVAR